MKSIVIIAALTLLSMHSYALEYLDYTDQNISMAVIIDHSASAAAECEGYLQGTEYRVEDDVVTAAQHAAHACIVFSIGHRVLSKLGYIQQAIAMSKEEVSKTVTVQQLRYIHYTFRRTGAKVFDQ